MSTFQYPLEVGDPSGSLFEEISALVDTGATFTVVPADVLERLGVAWQDTVGGRPGD
jgi:predicted aspartyl protease